ncbi:MAG: FecR domain-containing protein [Synergistaceae bacterium]|jgi:hypothetical protein|nr:FecR domain-containing protein [Synergistaceae bacterium]
MISSKHKRPFIAALCLLCLFILAGFILVISFNKTPAKVEGARIGVVIAADGEVRALRAGTSVSLATEDKVFLGDTVITGSGGKLQILLDDESSVTLGSGASLEFSEFAVAGRDSSFGANLSRGIMLVITGVITEFNPEGFKIKTPRATIGIRGTIFLAEVGDEYTAVRVYNSAKSVVVNDVEVKEAFKITIRRDAAPEILQLTEEDITLGEELVLMSGDDKPSSSPSVGSEDNGDSSSTTYDEERETMRNFHEQLSRSIHEQVMRGIDEQLRRHLPERQGNPPQEQRPPAQGQNRPSPRGWGAPPPGWPKGWQPPN